MDKKDKNIREVRAVVISDKMEKTRVLEIKRSVPHRLYHKRVLRSTKVMAHDEKNESKTGDTVLAISCRPLSKNKHFRIKKVLEKRI